MKPKAVVAQIFNLSVSPEIVARCRDLLVGRDSWRAAEAARECSRTPVSAREDARPTFWLRLRRAALYRRFGIGRASRHLKAPTFSKNFLRSRRLRQILLDSKSALRRRRTTGASLRCRIVIALPNRVALFVALSFSFCLVACHKNAEATKPGPSIEAASKAAILSPWFEEVAAQAGIAFRHSSGHATRFYFPEIETGGVGLLDFDGDGLLDIFFVNGGSLDPGVTNTARCQLYHNLGHWKFADVTARAGVSGHGEYGMGCACADFNGDGRPDIFVTHLKGGILYRNNGDGTFADVTQPAGIANDSWGTSAAFLDYDADGHLDLIVANYIRWSRETELNCYSRGGLPDYCSPVNYKAPAMDTLYRNRGDGAFANVTVWAGLDKAYGNGLGVACADFDHDGRIDIFIANDAMPNQLWINKGDGHFVDEALIRGCAVNNIGMPRAGMGIAAVDIRQTGWLDLFVTHLVGEWNGWFANTNGSFTDSVGPKGPNAGSVAFTGFGVGFADFDQDGILDLYVANGRVKYGARDLDPRDPYAEPNTLRRGLGDGQFDEVSPQGGTVHGLLGTSRGAAFGDLDNDGGVDIVVLNRDGAPHVLRNVVRQRGQWISFRVLNRAGSDAINATVRLEAQSRVQFREVMPNQGYCSSNDPRVHFGLGPAQKVDRVVVRWRRGAEESFGAFEAGHSIELREGRGQPAPGTFGY